MRRGPESPPHTLTSQGRRPDTRSPYSGAALWKAPAKAEALLFSKRTDRTTPPTTQTMLSLYQSHTPCKGCPLPSKGGSIHLMRQHQVPVGRAK